MRARTLRFFAVVAFLHFVLSSALLIASFADVLDSDAGVAPTLGARAGSAAAQALVFPISIARRVLPEPWAPRYGPVSLAGCSLLTAMVATLVLAALRRRRSSPAV